jgi:crotonobetainyl-CoA:carnitine CoA-transferase CaiB-like acyl-CoA transferase
VHVPYNTFRTRTRHLIIAVITDNFWENLVELLGDDELRRPEFATQPGRFAQKAFIEQRVQKSFETQTCEHWLEALAKYRIPAAPVNDLGHAFSDPQAVARHMTVTVPLPDGSAVEEPGNPVKLSDTYEDLFTPPPLLGQHTRSILSEFLKLDEAEIERLAEHGAIGV